MRKHSGVGGRIAGWWKGAAALIIIAALVPAGAAFAQDDGACGSTYTVDVGDTLYSIAQTCGTTVEAMLDANPSITDPALIYAGTELNVPGGEDGGEEPPEEGAPEEGEPAVSLSPDSGEAGTFVDVTVSGFPADTEVTVDVGVADSEPTTSVTEMTDEDGALETTVTIPADEAEAGETWVVAVSTEGEDAVEASAEFEVVAAGDEGDGTETGGTYTVQAGDTLYSIAQRYETTVEAMLDANPDILDASVIRVGQVINVPTVDQGGSGEEEGNEEGEEAAGEGEEEGGTYTVQAGDTLYRIAVRHETTVEEMLDLNPAITDPAMIYVGQVLNVP
jgi:peptidoglycan endopeptidase LytF